MLLLSTLAVADTIEVELKLAPGDMTTIQVEVGAPPSTHTLVSGIPFQTTLEAVPHDNGVALTASWALAKGRVDRSVPRKRRRVLTRTIRDHDLTPTIVVPRAGYGEFMAGGDDEDGAFVGIMLKGWSPK